MLPFVSVGCRLLRAVASRDIRSPCLPSLAFSARLSQRTRTRVRPATRMGRRPVIVARFLCNVAELGAGLGRIPDRARRCHGDWTTTVETRGPTAGAARLHANRTRAIPTANRGACRTAASRCPRVWTGSPFEAATARHPPDARARTCFGDWNAQAWARLSTRTKSRSGTTADRSSDSFCTLGVVRPCS